MVDNTLAEQETRLGALCLLLAQVGRKPTEHLISRSLNLIPI